MAIYSERIKKNSHNLRTGVAHEREGEKRLETYIYRVGGHGRKETVHSKNQQSHGFSTKDKMFITQ